MKHKTLIFIFIIAMSPFFAGAQGANNKKHKAHHKTAAKPMKAPDWAAAHHYDATAHAYFPDYYTYYDPNRGGYVYWKNGSYTFTPSLPPFMKNEDLAKSRVQILKGLSLDLHPEQNYPHYMQLYPAVGGNDGRVPVPIPGNPGQ
ncbi:MAG: hypothetical protein JWQ38_1542 [Flavipsychrobacter sp.]|nr:hypothetical protein [Flavipsychrobacter sp.]